MALIKARSRGINLADNFAFTGTITGAGGGKILQVVQGTDGSQRSSNTTDYFDSSLSCQITPSASTSKILIIVRQQANGNVDNDSGGSTICGMRLLRDSTAISTTDDVVYARGGLHRNSDTGFKYLDTPNTTSQITYKTQYKKVSGSTLEYNTDGIATMILMEVGA